MEFRDLMKNVRKKAIKVHKEYEEKIDEIRKDKQKIWEKIKEQRKKKQEILDVTTSPEQGFPKSPRPPIQSSIYKEKEYKRRRDTKRQDFKSEREVTYNAKNELTISAASIDKEKKKTKRTKRKIMGNNKRRLTGETIKSN